MIDEESARDSGKSAGRNESNWSPILACDWRACHYCADRFTPLRDWYIVCVGCLEIPMTGTGVTS